MPAKAFGTGGYNMHNFKKIMILLKIRAVSGFNILCLKLSRTVNRRNAIISFWS